MKNRWLAVLLYSLLALFPMVLRALESGEVLNAGPMLGFSSMRSVTIWLQGKAPGEVRLDYWPADRPQQSRPTEAYPLQQAEDFTAHIRIDDLEPGTSYAYRVRLDGVELSFPEPLRFRTQPGWPWQSAPPDFTVALGSCAYINDPPYERPGEPYGGQYEIFSAIRDQHPDLMLWLGDNVYFREVDYGSPGGMAYRYRHSRALPELQALLRATQHVALWDDHDYGPNNANRSFIFKNTSLTLFQRYWANPGYGLPDAPGIFTQVSYGDADFFLLDNRSYRSSDHGPEVPGKSMLGAAQLDWLQEALLASQAAFKFIANGSQMLNDHNAFEGWNHFAGERAGFLAWLRQARVSGLVFLSGDRHHTELLRAQRGIGYPLYELTCSPMTSGVHEVQGPERANPMRARGTLVNERNFCLLDFSGVGGDRRLGIQVFDSHGARLWQRQIAGRTLKPR